MDNSHTHLFTADEVRWMFGLEPERLERREQVISVPGPRDGERLYPAYQFDPETGRPWSLINTLLLQFEAAGLLDWLTVWLEEPCTTLNGRTPASQLGTRPAKVFTSASRFLLHHQTERRKRSGSDTDPNMSAV